MHILHLNQRNQILFRYLRDKEKKKEGSSEKKGGGVKIHPFYLSWIRAWGGGELCKAIDPSSFFD